MSINSPLGRRNLAAQQSQQPQQRVLSVPDESMEYEEEDFTPRNPYAQGPVPTHLQPNMPAKPHLQQQQLRQPQTHLDEVKDMRRQVIASSTRVSSDARDRLNYLAGIGRQTEDVPVDSTTYSLRTLKGKEGRLALKAASKFPDGTPENYYTLRNYSLAQAIYAIDGMDLEMIIGDATIEAVIEHLLDEMDDVVVDFIYSKFLALHNRQKSRFSLAPETLKEVAEDVKKS